MLPIKEPNMDIYGATDLLYLSLSKIGFFHLNIAPLNLLGACPRIGILFKIE